jgi:hypothetical protein
MCVNCNLPLPLKLRVARALGLYHESMDGGGSAPRVTAIEGAALLNAKPDALRSLLSGCGRGHTHPLSNRSLPQARHGLTALVSHNCLRTLLAGLPPAVTARLLHKVPGAAAAASDDTADVDISSLYRSGLDRVNFTNVNQFEYVIVGEAYETATGIDFAVGLLRDAPSAPPARCMPRGYPVEQLCFREATRLRNLSACSPLVTHCAMLLQGAGLHNWQVLALLERAAANEPGRPAAGIHDLHFSCARVLALGLSSCQVVALLERAAGVAHAADDPEDGMRDFHLFCACARSHTAAWSVGAMLGSTVIRANPV